jgi:hypothetical protein
MGCFHGGKAERSQVLGCFRGPPRNGRSQGTAFSMRTVLGLFVVSAAVTPLVAQETIPVPLNVMRYARHLIEEYDGNGDGLLQAEEWKEMRGDPRTADANGDDLIDLHELARYITDYGAVRRIRLMPSSSESLGRLPPLLYDAVIAGDSVAVDPEVIDQTVDTPVHKVLVSPPTTTGEKQFTVKPSRLPPGLPPWFQKLDTDGDGQVTLSEFAPTASATALREFQAYDHNRDGVITPQEAAAGPTYPSVEETEDND